MRKTPLVLAAALTVVASGCYRDFDFGVDSKSDYAVVDASNGTWTDLGTGTQMASGTADDWPVPGDWNKDHFWDKAVVRRSTGQWITGTPEVGTVTFAQPPALPQYSSHFSLTNLPVPADYDGDGDMDPAWYRESDGKWFIEGGDPNGVTFGTGPTALPDAPTGTDITRNDYDFPVPADYDGDGKDDLSTFNPWTGKWRVRKSSTGLEAPAQYFTGNQLLAMAVPGDYDGVGHAQRAVYGPNGWFIEGHTDPDTFGSLAEGETGIPAPADFLGTGKVTPAFVGYNANIWQTKGSATTVQVNGDQWPVPAGFNLRHNMGRLRSLGDCFDFGTC